jgi:hypothetical protein
MVSNCLTRLRLRRSAGESRGVMTAVVRPGWRTYPGTFAK